VTYLLCGSFLRNVTIGSFILAMGVVTVVPNVIFAVLFVKSAEMKGMLQRVLRLMNRGER